ncbi:MAG: dihydroorotase [Acidimicrobiia bacterium]|nr:dihydroorotase [Acidimicrobiia bacterium]
MTLRNATVATSAGVVDGADVTVTEGVVTGIGVGLGEVGEVIDCTGMWVGPGFVDIHTHLREPGQEWKEDIESGSRAAAAGGFTAIVAMPNTDPATDAGHLARYVVDRGRQVGIVSVSAAGAISEGRLGQRLAHLDELWDAGVRVYTDDGDTVADAGLLRRAMEYLAERGGVIAQHCIDPGLAAGGHMHEGTVSSRLGMAGVPRQAEETIIERDLALVRLSGCRYHVQHISTAGAVSLVASAKAEGLPVTAEATPHHLAFDHGRVEETDPVYKMMPPLRDPEDVAAVRDALRDGTIDCVATDHAPHAAHEKDVPWEDAPFGVTGLEWAAAVVNTHVGLDPLAFFDRMSTASAAIAQIPDQGSLREGEMANLVVFDPAAEADTSQTLSKSSNAPYLGSALTGSVQLTVANGEVTHRLGSEVTT